ncbi:glycosyltransferase family 2 protein [Mucilaginibacter hurinus]|uniref:Glycosyltransferase family 2 protein n=1 Tax=Mucilaginibacter hurinus TaxID=2201324 RepID=A0A367GQH3_9SPHI|nr:glycosyltransferase family 2 protein [Mucilaginibacter hurinus]RCH55116.1 glycosyltransferase family 2 protein [Mucilaginibacter hurinus]
MIAGFWISLFIVFYAFIGYGIVLFMLIKVKRAAKGKPLMPEAINLPACTLVVAAYNEERFIREKIINSLDLKYPDGKLKFIFITDGSTDATPDIIAGYPQIKLMHNSGRSGKIAAVHRAVAEVDTEIVVFTDANTFLNAEAIVNICRHYADKNVGAVAGEKRVHMEENADATAGEGFYWKYESKLKAWDSELYSVVGAAGELFSIRRELYVPVQPDTILDDFMISLLITIKGYRVVYEPAAYAIETASANIKEELKRKVRIAAGGIQSILRLKPLLNPFNNFILSFQYVSHRVLRWTVVPFLMILALVLNILIVGKACCGLYLIILAAQAAFYGMALLGWILESQQIKVKIFFIPYYFCMMNYAVIRGIFRYAGGRQSAVWEKSQRQ